MNRKMHIREEAARCMLCVDAPCSKVCKNGNPARTIRAIRFGNEAIAGQWVENCSEAELQAAEAACIHYDRPIRIKELMAAVKGSRPHKDLRQPRLIGTRCVGCHLCRLVCPVGAIGTAKRIAKKK